MLLFCSCLETNPYIRARSCPVVRGRRCFSADLQTHCASPSNAVDACTSTRATRSDVHFRCVILRHVFPAYLQAHGVWCLQAVWTWTSTKATRRPSRHHVPNRAPSPAPRNASATVGRHANIAAVHLQPNGPCLWISATLGL